MKYIFTIVFVCFHTLFFSQNKKVEPFLETIITQFPNVRDLAIVNNNEVIFSAQSVMGDFSALVTSKYENGTWSNPEVISFSGQYFDIEPFFSGDGLTLYFASNRPLDDTSNSPKDFDIWYTTRASLSDKWSQPKNLGAPINTSMDEFYPIITNSKNIYFTLDNPELKQKDNIYISEYINGKYSTPKILENTVNSEGYEFNAFIAPDESYLIYTCYNRPDGLGSGDLYISFKTENGWTEAKNMGDVINSSKMEYCPFVDANNILYFTSKRLAPIEIENNLNIDELKTLFNSYENGASRLYKIDISELLKR